MQEEASIRSNPAISSGSLSHKEIDEFGEIAVKRLTQPYRVEFSSEDVKNIVAAYKAGKSTHKISQQYNCCKTTISNLLKRNGISVTNAKAQGKFNAQTVIHLYEEMHTTEEIAKLFGVSPYTINRCLRENGVKIRSRWDYEQKQK